MSQSVPVFIVDAFTQNRFAGNPAAVYLANVNEPNDIIVDYNLLQQSLPSTEICQKIATEFNLSETAFPFPIDKQLTFSTGILH
jgi:predicted PhzF superfamily epimerase YddE/YHI9